MKRFILLAWLLAWCLPLYCQPLYFCMAADTQYYKVLLNLIGSIHRYNFDDTGEIAIFDIGFTPEQRTHLNSIAKVTVYDVELTNPDLLTRFKARGGRRNVPGWYAWKPVAIAQAVKKYEEVLYIDAGVELRRNVRPCFELLHQQGHMLLSSIRNIRWMITDTAINLLDLQHPRNAWLLAKSTTGITAYLMGFTRARYADMLLPLCELTKDLRYFAEDGSNPTARHDQTLFSIYARRLNLKLTPEDALCFTDRTTRQRLSINDMFRFNMHIGDKEFTMIPFIRYKTK